MREWTQTEKTRVADLVVDSGVDMNPEQTGLTLSERIELATADEKKSLQEQLLRKQEQEKLALLEQEKKEQQEQLDRIEQEKIAAEEEAQRQKAEKERLEQEKQTQREEVEQLEEQRVALEEQKRKDATTTSWSWEQWGEAEANDDSVANENGDAAITTRPSRITDTWANLPIPFISQAPEWDRNQPWQDACEEASIILAAHYVKWVAIDAQKMKAEVLKLVDIQNELFGDYIDTDLRQTQQLYEAYFSGSTKILETPTVEQIQAELDAGHPIVAPLAWKMLRNRYYTDGGPTYHMLVIRGYDENGFYTNDVGTRRGENYFYPYDTFMSALHDLVRDGDITTGQKRVLVVME